MGAVIGSFPALMAKLEQEGLGGIGLIQQALNEKESIRQQFDSLLSACPPASCASEASRAAPSQPGFSAHSGNVRDVIISYVCGERVSLADLISLPLLNPPSSSLSASSSAAAPLTRYHLSF